MPADFHIDTRLRMVFSKATGVFGLPEARGHMNRLAVHPDFRPEFNQLFDFREIMTVALRAEDVRNLAKRAVFSTSSRRAFFVSDNVSFGMSRIFGTYRELAGESGIRIFTEMSEALTWLGLSGEPEIGLFSRLNSLLDWSGGIESVAEH